jgi:hypothetical protein
MFPLVKEQIGNGIYISNDGYGITLTTKRSYYEAAIYLEPSVLEAMLKYVERMKGN